MQIFLHRILFILSLAVLCAGLYWQHVGPKINRIVYYHSLDSLEEPYMESHASGQLKHPRSYGNLRRVTSKSAKHETRFRRNPFTMDQNHYGKAPPMAAATSNRSAMSAISLPIFTSAIIVGAFFTVVKLATRNRDRNETRIRPNRTRGYQKSIPRQCDIDEEEDELLRSIKRRAGRHKTDWVWDIFRYSKTQNLSAAISYLINDFERQKILAQQIMTNCQEDIDKTAYDTMDVNSSMVCHCCCHSEHKSKRTRLTNSLEPLIEYEDAVDSESN